MSARGPDTVDRALTETEVAERDALRPALAEWSAYLVSARRVGTLVEAVEANAPLESAARLGARTDDWPMAYHGYVNPRLAWSRQWRPDRDPAVTPAMLAEAIAWMGARPPTTMWGRGETDRRSPHRDPVDWYRCSAEMVGRLQMGFHVPVLTGLTGRDRAATVSERTMRAARARAAMWVDPDTMVRVLRSLVDTGEPTSLYRAAVAEHRPLVLRRRGRPGAMPFQLDMAAVAPSTVSAFVRSDGPRLEVPALHDDGLEAVLSRVVDTYPAMASRLDRLRPVDGDRQMRTTGWLRLSLPALGLQPWSADRLMDELRSFRGGEYRPGTTNMTTSRESG